VDQFVSAHSLRDRTRVFLKVQDGCDYNCSFCTIPAARGRSRSDSIANVCQKAEEIAAQGTREIVLTGINLGDFGKGSRGGKKHDASFFDLVKALDKHTSTARYRISSIEPNLLSDDIIEFVAGSRAFMPHFHVPLQSGSNRILGLMQRRYRRELYAEKVSLIKKAMPHCAIGVDVITGFPSETETDFLDTYDFLQHLDVSYLHVFTYSERRNTSATEIVPPVPIPERQQRTRRLRNLSQLLENSFRERHRGQVRNVLFEGVQNDEMMEGYSDNYIKVRTHYHPERVNQIIPWQL
jgi:threonylcarbamoyladenosine tRNA methylthiotransferase MtaB